MAFQEKNFRLVRLGKIGFKLSQLPYIVDLIPGTINELDLV